MDNLLESNERTLVMFDLVCSGLSECLAIVHADIRQMTEHRNKLAHLEREQIQAKLIPPQALATVTSSKKNNKNTKSSKNEVNDKKLDDDPHHLAGLKLLDKRLADNLSRALSMNDLQKSSIAAKHQANQSRPSIFQVLLGKSGKSNEANKRADDKENSEKAQEIDNKMIIDDINRQIVLAMQYSKQLEAHLFRVEDLKTKYEMHLKMGLVVKSISRVYLPNGSTGNSMVRQRNCGSLVINDYSSNGKTKKQEMAASKTTIKEFIENIDKIESKFEAYMGSFLFVIEDIQGFARVCQGDVFEISIKYGDAQKFKTKISVQKDNRQKCDNTQTVFKARIADRLGIKAYECKGLGKRILLGHKFCETRDLFTARSQLMTISLNQTGSIKLNLVITWNPLHLAPNSSSSLSGVDISHISLPPTSVSSSTLSSLSSGPSYNGVATLNTKSHRTKFINSLHQPKHQHHESVYQTIDPNYGYYIPPPDYITTDQKYRDC